MELKIAHISYAKHTTDEEDLLDRKFISDLAKKGGQIKRLGAMCHTCAFKFDSEANLEPENVARASDCLLMGNTFNCHIEKGVDKGCECVGFQHARQYLNSMSGETVE